MPVRWVTFDCYGTLIDWERGVTDALRPHLRRPMARRTLARRYIETEAAVEAETYRPYRDVLDVAGRRLLASLGSPLARGVRSPLPASLPDWRPFPEVPEALRELRRRGRRIAILSNVDRALLERSIRRLGVDPDLAITAEDCGSYKPAPGHWRMFAKRTGAKAADTVHVGASQYHDMRPAAALRYRTVFIDRHGERLETKPTRVLPDLARLPQVIDELARG